MSDEELLEIAESLLVPQDGSEPKPERVQASLAFSQLVIARNSRQLEVDVMTPSAIPDEADPELSGGLS